MNYQQPLPSFVNKLPNNNGYAIINPGGKVGLLKPTQNGNFIYIPPYNTDGQALPDVNETPPPVFIDNGEQDDSGDHD